MKILGRRINIKKVLIVLAIVIIILLVGNYISSFSKRMDLGGSSFEKTEGESEDTILSEGRTGVVGALKFMSASSSGGTSSSYDVPLEERRADDTGGILSERKIINKADFQIEVEDYDKTYDKIVSLAMDLGEYISNSKTEISKKGAKKGFITIRVSSDKFYGALPQIETLGKIESKQISGEDVTEKYVDIRSRLNNAKNQEQRFLEILQKAETIEEILRVEQELNRIREQVEVYEGQIRYMDDLTSLATITVNLHEPEAVVERGMWDTIKQAIKESIELFIKSILTIIILLAKKLIYIIILFILYFVFRKKIKNFFSEFLK